MPREHSFWWDIPTWLRVLLFVFGPVTFYVGVLAIVHLLMLYCG